MSRKTRKLIWSAPLVAALAVVGALAIFMAQTPGAALAHDPPGVVGNLMGMADGHNQIDLSWDAPTMGDTATSYRIDRSMNGNTWMTHKMGHTMTKYSDTGLKPGMSYYYRVFAVNAAGTGPVSQDYQVQTDVAEVPGGIITLMAQPMGQNQINLTWVAPAKIGGSPITKYSIHFAMGTDAIPIGTETATNAGVMDVDAADGTSYMHKMLTAGTRYRYVVYAHNVTGKSTMASNTVAAMTAKLEKPGAPTGVTAVQTGARDFNLYWYAPTETGGDDISGYEVHVSFNGGSFAEEAGITWTGTGATVSVDASDTVPDDNGATPPVPYTTVQYRVYTLTGTGEDELKSASYGQSGRMTIIADAMRPAAVPAAPDFSNADTADLDADRDPKGNVNLKWTAPDSGGDDQPPSIGGYRIDVSDDGMAWRSLVNHTRKTATEYQYVDAEMKNRSYRIFAWHAQYLGPAQTDVVVSNLTTDDVVAPGHVRSFTATARGPMQIDLAWTAPASDGNADIALYRIDGVRQAADGTFVDFPAVTSPADALPTADMADGTVLATSKTTGYMHKKLNAGETWKYRVLVVTNDGETTGGIRTSDGASAETRMATTAQADLPEAPEGLTAEDAKDSSKTGTADRGVLLLWNAPDPPGGAMIDGYRIQRKKGNAAWETLVMDTNNIFTDYTDRSEPEAGEVRQYQVAALNGSKVGAYSDKVYYPHTHGTAPSGAMASVSGSSVTVTWTDGQNVGGHGVVLFTSDFSAWPHIGRGTGQTHTFSNVASGTYIAVVVALDAQGGLITDAQGGYLFTAATAITVP